MGLIGVLKKLGAHGASGGLSALLVFQLLSAQVQQANTRADTAMITAAASKGVIEGIDQNLKWFMINNGVTPISESEAAPAETVAVWRYIDVPQDDSVLVAPDSTDTL